MGTFWGILLLKVLDLKPLYLLRHMNREHIALFPLEVVFRLQS